jgi:hypothetical protein
MRASDESFSAAIWRLYYDFVFVHGHDPAVICLSPRFYSGWCTEMGLEPTGLAGVALEIVDDLADNAALAIPFGAPTTYRPVALAAVDHLYITRSAVVYPHYLPESPGAL